MNENDARYNDLQLTESFSVYTQNLAFGILLGKVLLNEKNHPSDLKVLYINHSFELMTGISGELIVEKTARELLATYDSVKFDFISVLGQIAHFESRARFQYNSDRLQRWFQINAYSPLKGYFIALLNDITNEKIVSIKSRVLIENNQTTLDELEKKLSDKNEEIISLKNHYEEALKKAETSNKAKSSFLANMSHEIRTPLNGMIGFADLLSDAELPDDKRIKYAEIINNNGRQLLAIINEIIDLSKIEAGQVMVNKINTNINDLLDQLYLFFSASKHKKENVKLEIIKSTEEIICVTDETKLRQILTNLILNALKFTENGSVTSGYKLIAKDDVEYLEFYISDTGIGIDESDIDIIFERFRQVEKQKYQGGTGLGLPISKAYIELLGGQISVISSSGKGSTFTFNIPYEKARIEDNQPIEITDKSPQFKGKRILIAEDEEINFYYLCEILESTGAEVLYAHNGAEAVDIFKSYNNIDMVLMDIKMPVMNGFEATRQIKLINKQCPVIAQTAFAFSDDLDKAMNAGIDDYLTKPILKDLLIQKLTKYIP